MLCAHLWPASHAKERRRVLSCTRSNSLQFLSPLAHHPLTHLLKCIHSCWWNSSCQLHYIAMPIITPDWSWVVTVSSRVAPYSRDLKPPRLQLCGSGPLCFPSPYGISHPQQETRVLFPVTILRQIIMFRWSRLQEGIWMWSGDGKRRFATLWLWFINSIASPKGAVPKF